MADDDKVITCRCGNPLNTVAALEAMFLRTDVKPGHNSWVRCNRCGANILRRSRGDYYYPPRSAQKQLGRTAGDSPHRSAISELRKMKRS